MPLDAERARNRMAIATTAVVLAQVAIAVVGLIASRRLGQGGVQAAAEGFFRHLLLTGIFLHALLLAVWCFGFRIASPVWAATGVLAISVAMSVLLASNARSGSTPTPQSFSGLLYIMLAERQALLALFAISIVTVVAGIYYVLRSYFTVEYTGSGIQIRMPGHTIYYIPIFPQVTWQNTGIHLRKGERIQVELSGYVSPGALQEISQLEEQMKRFLDWEQGGSKPETWRELPQPVTWPYCRPIGYLPENYAERTMLPVFKKHPLYRQPNYYKKDKGLTVKGLPHVKVVGIIRAEGDPPPRESTQEQEAYDWDRREDQEELLLLSSDSYPITIEAKRSGKLFVVVNDVDWARWDNGGMFFLRAVRLAWLAEHRPA